MDKRKSILEMYLRDKRKLAKTTKEAYSQSVQCLFDFCVLPLQEIIFEVIVAWLKHLKEARSCSPATIRIRFSAVKSFFSYLTEEGIIDSNPTIGIKGPKLQKTNPPCFPPATIFQLRDATNDSLRLGTLIEVLYCTGARVTELINIKIQDIIWDDNAILITTAKRKIQRYVFFTYQCRCLLEMYIKSRKNEDDCPYLFINHHKKQLTRQGVSFLLNKITESQLDTHIHAHMFRHSLGTRLVEMGATLPVTAKILGHKDLRNTRRYVQYSSKTRKKNYDKFF
jgi:site-specific recombinase XerD